MKREKKGKRGWTFLSIFPGVLFTLDAFVLQQLSSSRWFEWEIKKGLYNPFFWGGISAKTLVSISQEAIQPEFDFN